jgi:hypothetical protein
MSKEKLDQARESAQAKGRAVYTGQVKNQQGMNGERGKIHINDILYFDTELPFLVEEFNRNGEPYPAVAASLNDEDISVSWNRLLYPTTFTLDPNFDLKKYAGKTTRQLLDMGAPVFTAFRYGNECSKCFIRQAKAGDDEALNSIAGLPDNVVFDAEAYEIPFKYATGKTPGVDPQGRLRKVAYVSDGLSEGSNEPIAEPAAPAAPDAKA